MLLLFIIACGYDYMTGDGDEEEQTEFTGNEGSAILAIGDSMLAWNREEGASIPEVIGEELDLEVNNVAVSGAYISADEEDMHIPNQYAAGDWPWVVMDGGGNDLMDECGCGDCDENLNTILSEDGDAGELFDLVQQITDDGSRVALIGYFSMPQQAEEFSNCNDELAVLVERATRMSENIDGMIFFDSRQIVSYEETPYAYDEDYVHPSIEGSELVGVEVADAMLNAE